MKASPSSDMSVIWINIWDSQKGSKGKTLINRSFNFEHSCVTQLQSEGLLCTLEWPSVTTAGAGVTQHMPVVLKVLSVRSVVVLTELRTTGSWLGVVGAPIHPDWTQVVQFPQNSEQTPRVMCFIHSRLSRLHFALRRDIVDHRDIQLLSFFNRGQCQFLMNVYSDDLYTAINFLSNAAPNIPHLLYMGGDFNVYTLLFL